MNIAVIILAAGQGTRMRSAQPKALHAIGGRCMLAHVIHTVTVAFPHLSPSSIHTVIGHGADQIEKQLQETTTHFIFQQEQLGTGHAVKTAAPACKGADIVLVLYADVPLIEPQTLKNLTQCCNGSSLALLTSELKDPKGYGRIVRNKDHNIQRITEEKDATEKEKTISEVNTGIMAIPGQYLDLWLSQLENKNAQQEFYLTDIVGLAVDQGVPVSSTQSHSTLEIMGVNNRIQQAQVEREFQRRQANMLMQKGTTLLDPLRIDVRGELSVGKDVIIDVNCIFEGNVSVGNNVTIGAGCIIRNSTIGDNTHIEPYSIIDSSHIEDQCAIGPFARLRPQTTIKSSAKIGNFVETKKTYIAKGSKINHLSYIGDAEIGAHVNIGAGTITCNFDGVYKYKTVIGDHAFVGSNTAIIAPTNIGAHATIGAGSTITENVDNGNLAIARSRQHTITGWQRPEKKGSKNK